MTTTAGTVTARLATRIVRCRWCAACVGSTRSRAAIAVVAIRFVLCIVNDKSMCIQYHIRNHVPDRLRAHLQAVLLAHHLVLDQKNQ